MASSNAAPQFSSLSSIFVSQGQLHTILELDIPRPALRIVKVRAYVVVPAVLRAGVPLAGVVPSFLHDGNLLWVPGPESTAAGTTSCPHQRIVLAFDLGNTSLPSVATVPIRSKHMSDKAVQVRGIWHRPTLLGLLR